MRSALPDDPVRGLHYFITDPTESIDLLSLEYARRLGFLVLLGYLIYANKLPTTLQQLTAKTFLVSLITYFLLADVRVLQERVAALFSVTEGLVLVHWLESERSKTSKHMVLIFIVAYTVLDFAGRLFLIERFPTFLL